MEKFCEICETTCGKVIATICECHYPGLDWCVNTSASSHTVSLRAREENQTRYTIKPIKTLICD